MTDDKPAGETFPSAAYGSDDPLPDHLPRRLEEVSRRLSAELGRQLSDPYRQLRGNHRRILQMIPPDGARITDLARLAGMTKQSLGEVVDYLEQSGFVASRRSAADGRVRLVARTLAGDEVVASTLEAVDAVERRWRAEIGADRYDTMTAALRDLGRDALWLF